MAKSKGYGGLIFLVLLIAGAGAGTWYYFSKKGDKQPEYSTVKVGRGTIVQTISATGNLQTTNVVTISSQVSGNVIAINADFNDNVKKGQWLLKIDPATYEQRVRQAKADLEAATANTEKTRGDVARTRELFEKKLVSQADYDASKAVLAQAESNLVSRTAALENANTDLARCTIYSPIDGVVLNRTTDVGGTVNVNQSAVALFVLIDDLTKLQIALDVSEADIGNVQVNQAVRFSVDAYLNRPFMGEVSQVRNYAKNNSGVVTFQVIVKVDNSAMLLKPGMTATANIIIAERPNVLTVANTALRVRIPTELLAKTTSAPAAPAAPASADKPAAPMSEDDRRAAIMEIMAAAGIQPGMPSPPDALEKAKKLAVDKGIDPVVMVQQFNRFRDGGGGRGNKGGGRRGGTGQNTGVGMNVSNQPRTVYKLVTDATGRKYPQATSVHLGISDGSYTQVLDGLAEGDTLITYVTMPGGSSSTPGGAQGSNPFQQGRGGPGGFGRGF